MSHHIPPTIVATLVLSLILAAPGRAQIADHLKCYQITDPLNLAAVVDLDSPQFGVEAGCKVSKAKFFCVPTRKTVVSAMDKKTKQPITPLPVSGPDPGNRICYNVTCPKDVIPDREVVDQFGIRSLSKLRVAILCTPACTQAVEPAKTPPVDVILVVDNSGSMTEEIAQVIANINQSLADLLSASGLDYRVIMISTKGTLLQDQEVCVAPPLGGAACGDNPPLYRAIDQDVASTNSLSLILSTYDSANPSLNWSTSLRYDAVKFFIEVTDDNSALSATTFDTQLLAKQPAGMFGTAANRNYVFHSIVGVTPGNPSIKCSTAVNNGAQYQFLSTLTGGGLYSVCASDYAPLLSEIANGIVAVGSAACSFAMPNGAGAGPVDPDKVGMRFTPSNGVAVDVQRVQDASQCSGNAWYFNDNSAPTRLLLCADTCSTVNADPGGKLEVVVGCVTG